MAPGQELVQEGGRSYSLLASYLGLPPALPSLLESPASASLVSRLLGSSSALTPCLPLPPAPLFFRRCLPPTSLAVPGAAPYFPLAALAPSGSPAGGLIPLPRDYTDLMNLAASYSCPNSKYTSCSHSCFFFCTYLFCFCTLFSLFLLILLHHQRSSCRRGEVSSIVFDLWHDGVQVILLLESRFCLILSVCSFCSSSFASSCSFLVSLASSCFIASCFPPPQPKPVL